MIQTKIKGLKGKLLNRIQYISLIEAGENFPKAISVFEPYSYIKNTNYTIEDRAKLQNDLYFSIINDINKLSMSFPQLKPLKMYVIKGQLIFLKSVFMEFRHKVPVYPKGIKKQYFENISNPKEFFDALKESIFYEALESVPETSYLFHLELCYLAYREKCLSKYPQLKKIARAEIDIANSIITKSSNSLIPTSINSKRYDLKNSIFLKKESSEKEYTMYLKNLYRRAAIFNNDPIFNIAYYFFLKEAEIKNLITIIEGIRYRENIISRLF